MSTRKLVADDLLMPYPGFVYLKSGGQKAVFKIDHPVFGAAVLKIGQVDSPDSLQRMEREVSLLKEIKSEYYPKHYEFKLETDDRFTILEEYIDAPVLGACLDKFSTTVSALSLIFEIIEGLKVLWAKRVVHRDLKPDNILILPSSKPKIIDLGIARLLDATSLTATFAFMGPCTPYYASPEQLTNRKAEIDQRADQFCLGIMLMQLLLNGEHPFSPSIVGGSSVVQNIVLGVYASPSSIAPKLKHFLSKLLAKEPYQRYRSIALMERDLEASLRELR